MDLLRNSRHHVAESYVRPNMTSHHLEPTQNHDACPSTSPTVSCAGIDMDTYTEFAQLEDGRTMLQAQRGLKARPLTETHTVIIRPRGGLRLASHLPNDVAKEAIARACLTRHEALSVTLNVRTKENLAILRTTQEKAATKLASITMLQLNGNEYPVKAYITAPQNSCKGVIHGIASATTSETLMEHLQSFEATILAARMMGSTRTAIITFEGSTVPRDVLYKDSVFRCDPCHPRAQFCYNCLHYGHRQDNCPTEALIRCRNCTKKLQRADADHTCFLLCLHCGGCHRSNDRVCPVSQEKDRRRSRGESYRRIELCKMAQGQNRGMTRNEAMKSSAYATDNLHIFQRRKGEYSGRQQLTSLPRPTSGPRYQATATAKYADLKMRELSDLDYFCGLEDYILLKLSKPWQESQLSAPTHLPKTLSIEYGEQCIRARATSLIENCEILCEHHVVAAIFAGCSAFESDRAFVYAAKKVLAEAQTLVIVHNRDYVVNLMDWFRSLDVLVLYHDLRLQTLPEGWEGLRGSPHPSLKRFIGCSPAMGMDNLFIAPEVVSALVSCCPQLREVEAPIHDLLDPYDPRLPPLLARRHAFLTSPILALGLSFNRLHGGRTTVDISSDITPSVMDRASMLFPMVRRLEVTTWHWDSVIKIRNFSDITDLSLRYEADTPFPFRCLLEVVLSKIRRLRHLSLSFVSDVSLTAIGTYWPGLQSLSLFNCSVVVGEPELAPGSLGSLLKLRLWLARSGEEFHKCAMNALLKATTHLTTLYLDGAVLCALFIIRCSEEPLPCLERLTLATDERLAALKVTPDDLRCIADALPSLRYVATDSVDFRLFFEREMPAVLLDWCRCTACALEFPLLNAAQSHIWNALVA